MNEVALAAFDELRHHYDDRPAFARNIGKMASLADAGELIVATVHEYQRPAPHIFDVPYGIYVKQLRTPA